MEAGQSLVLELSIASDRSPSASTDETYLEFLDRVYDGPGYAAWQYDVVTRLYFRAGSIVLDSVVPGSTDNLIRIAYGNPEYDQLTVLAETTVGPFGFLAPVRTFVLMFCTVPAESFSGGVLPARLAEGVDCRIHVEAISSGRYILDGSVDTTTDSAPTAEQLLTEMTALVLETNAGSGVANSYDAKLTAIIAALDDAQRGNRPSATNMLAAFINAAEGQRGNALTMAQADQLVNAAHEVMRVLKQD